MKKKFGIKSYIISEIKRMEKWRLEFYIIMLEAQGKEVNDFLVLQLFNVYYSKCSLEELEDGIA